MKAYGKVYLNYIFIPSYLEYEVSLIQFEATLNESVCSFSTGLSGHLIAISKRRFDVY